MPVLLRRLLLIIACLALTTCTRLDLAYRNLDVLVPWTLDDYLNMNSDQRTWLKSRLADHLAWHCQEQLPQYLDWLDQVRGMVARKQIDSQQLQARTAEAHAAVERVAQQITPSAVALLRTLDDRQVVGMEQAFAKDVEEKREKFVDPPIQQQIDERAERMEKRLKPWLGSVSLLQRQAIRTWSRNLGDQNRQWIDNRAHWQAQLSQALQERQAADFDARVGQLLEDRESLWTPQYRLAFQRTEQAGVELAINLLQESSPRQRQHLLTRLDELHSDFANLKCLRQAQAAN